MMFKCERDVLRLLVTRRLRRCLEGVNQEEMELSYASSLVFVLSSAKRVVDDILPSLNQFNSSFTMAESLNFLSCFSTLIIH